MSNARRCNEMSNRDYRCYPAINQSALKAFVKDPLEYIGSREGKFPWKDSKSMQFGRDLEMQVLHDEVPFVLIPDDVLDKNGHKRGNAWKAWVVEQEQNGNGRKAWLKAAEYEARLSNVGYAYDAIKSHKLASRLLLDKDQILQHMRIIWTDDNYGVECKAELDVVHKGGYLIDLKTAQDNTEDAFVRSVFNFQYYVQAQFYRRAMHELIGEWLPFIFIVVKNTPGFGVSVYNLSDEWLAMGEEWLNKNIPRFLHAQNEGIYLPEDWNMVTTISPRKWMYV